MARPLSTIHPNGDAEILIPMHTYNESNVGGKLRDRIKRKSGQRTNTYYALRAYWRNPPAFKQCVIVLTRYSKGKLDAHDNLPRSLKHVVDGVADWLKIDDRDERIQWDYQQDVGDPAVKIELLVNARIEKKVVRL